jgi:hypothetical protein
MDQKIKIKKLHSKQTPWSFIPLLIRKRYPFSVMLSWAAYSLMHYETVRKLLPLHRLKNGRSLSPSARANKNNPHIHRLPTLASLQSGGEELWELEGAREVVKPLALLWEPQYSSSKKPLVTQSHGFKTNETLCQLGTEKTTTGQGGGSGKHSKIGEGTLVRQNMDKTAN